jgi:hypothetical protein
MALVILISAARRKQPCMRVRSGGHRCSPSRSVPVTVISLPVLSPPCVSDVRCLVSARSGAGLGTGTEDAEHCTLHAARPCGKNGERPRLKPRLEDASPLCFTYPLYVPATLARPLTFAFLTQFNPHPSRFPCQTHSSLLEDDEQPTNQSVPPGMIPRASLPRYVFVPLCRLYPCPHRPSATTFVSESTTNAAS